MAETQRPEFVVEPSQEHPGWLTFDLNTPGFFTTVVLGPLIMRRETDRSGRLRCFPRPHLRNVIGSLHGGALLGMIDVSLFAGLLLLTDSDARLAVTLDLSTQFIGIGQADRPLDGVVEVLRETGRLVFLRGVLEQGDTLIAAFNGTVRKASPRS